MDLPIVVFTASDYNQVKQFQQFHLRYQRRFSLIITVLLGVELLLALLMGAVLGFSQTTRNLTVFAGASLLLFLFYTLSTAGVFYTRRQHAKHNPQLTAGSRFGFFDDRIESTNLSKDVSGTITYSYEAVYKACETNEMFYVYVAKNICLIVDKAGFERGTPDQLRALLQAKLPPVKRKYLRSIPAWTQ